MDDVSTDHYMNKLITIIDPGHKTTKGILKSRNFIQSSRTSKLLVVCQLECGQGNGVVINLHYRASLGKYREKIIEHDETEKILFKIEHDID